MAPGGRPVLDEQPGPGRHLSPATMDGRMPQMGAAAGREAEKGGPPRRLLATEAEEPGVGAREERTDAAGVRGCRGVSARRRQAGGHTRHRSRRPAPRGHRAQQPVEGEGADAAQLWGGGRQHIWPQRGRGVWGLGGPGSVSGTPGVQACDRGEGVGPEPPRCPGRQARSLSPHPCRKGGQGRVAAEAPTAGPAYAGRVRQVATGASREAGTGRSGAIGTWGGWRPGV